MKVIYHHNCIDGFTAAWCAWKVYGDSATYIPAQYNEPAPDVTGDDVLIVDFSYARSTLLAMRESAKSLRVLDHHKTAEEDLRGLDFCLFDMNRSGAGIAWDELHGSKRPKLVNYVEDRDLWRWKLPESKSVNAWIGSWDFAFKDWSVVAEDLDLDPSGVRSAGDAILRKDHRYVQSMCREARLIEFAGHVVPVVNAPYVNTSELVGALAENQAFAVGWFQRHDGKYQYSLRSRGDFDVAKLAESFGGGGHRNAAGFTVAERVHEAALPSTAPPTTAGAGS
jgi:oligoribonuclease NrnB/cAMP/cGMP phosphodiesterase (DHH superfamily)